MGVATAALFALAVAVAGNPGDAAANGVPQLVKLEYIDGVSNWGPEDAEGLLEFSFAEGYAIVDVKNLPPAAGFTFEGWMRTAAGDALFIGDITTDGAGIGRLNTKLTGLSRFDYSQFVVAARGEADTAGALPAQLNMAGNFTVIGEDPSSDAGETRPQVLPDTGERAERGGPSRLFMAMMAMSVTGLALVMVSQYRKRRRG
jgi:hypothetical protein